MTKVYVSSTYEDLQECRAKVREQLRRLGYEDAAMEYYNAEERTPMEKCLADVADCDVYIGIFAFRNGWVPTDNNSEGLSISEMEYRTAGENGKERLIFLLDENALWPPAQVDDDKTLIKEARRRVSQHQRGTFANADDLAAKISAALKDWEKRNAPEAAAARASQIDTVAYFDALRRRYGSLDLDALAPPQKEEFLQLELNRVFVEQSAREDLPRLELPKEVWEKLAKSGEVHADDLPTGVTMDDVRRAREAYHAKPSRGIVDIVCEPQNSRVTILGDPGAGKSTFARYVLLSLIETNGDARIQRELGEYLPILIELRNFMGVRDERKECKTFLDFLEHLAQTEGYGLERSALQKQLKDGKTLVIFDGLDEIFDPKERETITQMIAAFGLSSPGIRVIATSRIIGYRHKILSDARFAHLTLQDLNRDQVEQFVRQWFGLARHDKVDEAENRTERILRAFDESASIRQLAGNPMLLTIMSIIGKNQELPRERYKLYEHASNVLIQHWDVNKFLQSQIADLNYIDETDKQEMLRRLAFKMQNGKGESAGNHIQREELQNEFERYLTSQYDLPRSESKTVAQTMLHQFHDRNFILSFYGADVYGFVHRAFLEYFCAASYVRAFEKTKELTLDQLKQEVFGAHWNDQSWHEVLRLICSMIDEKWVAEILTYLVRDVYSDWREHLCNRDRSNRQPWHLALAVGCLSEVRNFPLVSEPARELLSAACDYLHKVDDRYYFPGRESCTNSIMTAAAYIGPNWPHRETMASHDIFNDCKEWETTGRFIGIVGTGSELVHKAVVRQFRRGANSRTMALCALSQGWPHQSDTAKFFRASANDSAPIVRDVSLSLAARLYGNEKWFETLIYAAVNDTDSSVTISALNSLVMCYGGKPATLKILIECAQDDKHSFGTMIHALIHLVQCYREQYDVTPLVRSKMRKAQGYGQMELIYLLLICAPQDEEAKQLILKQLKKEETRILQYYLPVLIAPFGGDQEIVLTIREIASSSTTKWTRRAVLLELIIRSQSQRSDTIAFLQERAKKERSKRIQEVLRRGIELLSKQQAENAENALDENASNEKLLD